jgi:hypothetical protein
MSMNQQRTDLGSGTWEKIRRVLGRLISGVQVHDLPSTRFAPLLKISGENTLTIAPGEPGRSEAAWSPAASIVSLPPPFPMAGGENADLATVTAVVGLDAALSPQRVPVWASPSPELETAVHHSEFRSVQELAPALWAASVGFAASVIRSDSSRLAAPAVARLSVESLCLPKKRGRERSILPFQGIRVRASVAACAEAALIRTRRPTPPGVRLAQAFGAERQRLAQSAQVDLADVVLLGVYPQVPVAAVRRLAVGEDGAALSLWLKPEALIAAAAGRPPRLATLIIGRLRSTGRMIQAVA